MAALDFAVTVRLLDQLTAPLKSVSKAQAEANKQFSDTQKRLAELNAAQKNLDGYRQLKDQLHGTTKKLSEAKDKAKELALKLKETNEPSKRLTQQFEKAKAAVNALNAKQLEQIRTLDTLRGKIIASGVPMRSLIEAQRHLRTETASTNKSLEGQKAVLDQVAAKHRRLAESQKAVASARRQMQDKLQMQQDIAGVAYPMLAVGSAGMYAATRPIVSSATHSDSVADIAITGNMTRQAQQALSESLRGVALDTNQLQDEINKGVKLLVANGMSAKDGSDYATLLGDTATATRAQMEDISNLTFSLQNNLKIKGKGAMEEAMNNLVHAGKQGQFELKEMARYFPSLGAQMASMGATGQDAVKEIGIAMQAARKASGTSQEAASNMANWFSHMTSSSTIEHFDQAGIDLRKEMLGKMQNKDPEKRMSAFRASIEVFDQYVDKLTAGQTVTIRSASGKVKERLNFKDALSKSVKEGNEDEVRSIVERFGLSKVIQDMQTANFYLAMRQNKEFIDKGMKSFDGADVQNTIEIDKQRRMEEATEQWKQLKIQANDLSTSIGDSLMPTLRDLMETIKPVIESVNAWVKENPELTRTLLKIALITSAVIAGVGGLAVIIISILGPFAMLRYALSLAGINFAAAGGTLGILKGALMFLLSPIGLITAAVVAAVLVWQNWDNIMKYLQNNFPAIHDFFAFTLPEALDAATGYLKTAWEWAEKVFNTLANLAAAPFKIGVEIGQAVQTGGASIKSGEGVLGTAKAIGDRIFGKTAPDGARASGGPVRAGGIYRVNELGPELLRMRGQTYLMADQNANVIPLRNMVNRTNQRLFGQQGREGGNAQQTIPQIINFQRSQQQAQQQQRMDGVLNIKIDSKEPVRVTRMQATGMELNVHTGRIGGVS
ncbi:phage tail tape measure protein [Thiothrix sp.]|jgi:TP901 family phage tail tape measure protein|uniref:phage tail tape measure protein n=1 Tax=Thiothrix sp. TaxID=1032 RepID=UPI0025794D04|nr:phage tail tape measure protein [Thiothrix sp.]